MNFRTRKNSEFFVDIDTALFGETSRLVSYHSQISVQQNKAIVGAGAFRHSSGIHQDGVLKGAAYEIMSSGDVGWDGESIEITARSGKMGYQHRLERLGYASSDISACIEKIRDFGKALADEKGRLNDLDLRVITDTIVSPVRSRIVYKKTIRFVKEDGKYSAEVLLEVDGREVRGSSKHEGSIDALCSAIDSAVGIKLPKLIEYHPVNIGKGHSAVNETTIVLGENGRELTYAVKEPIYIGRARHQDTIEAAGRAYVDAINRYMSTNLT
jgi:2-isopropylmalate synthase